MTAWSSQVESHLTGSRQQVQFDVRVGQTVKVHRLQTLNTQTVTDVSRKPPQPNTLTHILSESQVSDVSCLNIQIIQSN